jgi:secretion/DNA translocation related TadE-like protein
MTARDERGAVTVLAVVAVALAVALAFGVARLGRAAGDRARADTAADAAALAAAGAIARGHDPASAAASTAAGNGARLVRCSCTGTRPAVEVRFGDATGRARAEVRFDCFAAPDRCEASDRPTGR